GAPPAASAPLFEAMGLVETDGRPPEALPELAPSEEVVGDYQSIRLSLKGHPVAFLRERLTRAGAVTARDYERLPDGRPVQVRSGAPPAASAPLFEAMGLVETDGRPPEALPELAPSEEVVGDYQSIRLSLKGHPVAFLRERLTRAGAVTARDYERLPDGRRVQVGGVVLVRQRPGTAKGVCFITLEDETGVANLVLWERVSEAFRPTARGARMVLAKGRVQRAEGVSHLVVE